MRRSARSTAGVRDEWAGDLFRLTIFASTQRAIAANTSEGRSASILGTPRMCGISNSFRQQDLCALQLILIHGEPNRWNWTFPSKATRDCSELRFVALGELFIIEDFQRHAGRTGRCVEADIRVLGSALSIQRGFDFGCDFRVT
jgi:hypothetical protein